MGQPVNGIRDTIYRDLAEGYLRDKEKSFLYRYFWREGARELLGRVLPRALAETPEGPADSRELRETLAAAMVKDRAWARTLLLREPPGKGRKERRDFWQELTLNDAGYQAGLIADTDYYRWLTSYLAARDIYYKDSGPWDTDGAAWLVPLLRAGLGTVHQGGLIKAQAERDLAELDRLLREERAVGKSEIAGRLHDLRQNITQRGRTWQADYLPWLTRRLERSALHNKIRTWLQNGGYPLRLEGPAEAPGEPRKQDFSLRLFDAYCRSPQGYDLTPRDMSGWRMEGRDFCVMDTEDLEKLLDALKRREGENGEPYLYLPLAVHLQSGCVFFLAGKAVYEDVYRQAARGTREAYDGSRALICFDYLRLNRAFWEADSGAAVGPFRLRPTFHENAERSYTAVLDDFKRHCVVGAKSALAQVRALNDEAPAGTPGAFLWAFYPPEEPGPSREGREAFYRTRDRAPASPAPP